MGCLVICKSIRSCFGGFGWLRAMVVSVWAALVWMVCRKGDNVETVVFIANCCGKR